MREPTNAMRSALRLSQATASPARVSSSLHTPRPAPPPREARSVSAFWARAPVSLGSLAHPAAAPLTRLLESPSTTRCAM